jgi:choline dehydrogenase-like flavoprotein
MAGVRSGRGESRDVEIDADVVVVGSGAGGAVVAAELAEAGAHVVVLEEGPFVPPAHYGAMRVSQSMRHLWRDGAMTVAFGLGNSPTINVTMGRCVGGSSVLTGGVCFRIPESILAEWRADHGLSELTSEALEPCYAAVERMVHVEEVPESLRSKSTHLFVAGARKMGADMRSMRRNTHGCNGCGRCNFGCPHGAKLSVDRTFLPRAVSRGATVWSDCRVDRVVMNGECAAGVVGRLIDGPDAKGHGRIHVRAPRVIVSAGSACSPLLLRRSGLGRASGQLGKNLTLHPAFRMIARFDEPVEGWKGALQSAYSHTYSSEKITLTGVFVPPGVLAATMPGIGPALMRRARDIPHLAMFGAHIHDLGGGRIWAGPGGRPILTYRMAAEDRVAVPRLIRIMGEAFLAAGAKELFPPILGLEAGMDADAFRKFPFDSVHGRRLECSSQHPLGTCRMGVSPKTSVVDPEGRVWGTRGLYVVDGSIIPTSLGVNPQLTIMTMATRLAWRMRERAD